MTQPYSSRKVPCPICGSLRLFSQRYPNALCNSCSHSADLVDSNGNPITFREWGIGGGLISIHHENGSIVERQESTCFLNGIECEATEARIGGLVVQILVACPMCHVPGIAHSEKCLGGLCYECCSDLVDANGNRVQFNYEDRLHRIGFISLHDENGTWVKKIEKTCFLNGKQCYAYDHDGDIIVTINDSVGYALRIM